MTRALRDAWTRIIQADDIDAHLHATGQARANAVLVAGTLAGVERGARVLFAGAGTGQMFDYVPASLLTGLEVIFTDINPRYLAKLEVRLAGTGLTYQTVIDDIEAPALRGPFDAVLAVLVLEHVEWRSALRTIAGWAPRAVHLIIQRNPPEMVSAVTPGRELPGSLAEFARTAHPILLDEGEVRAAMARLGFRAEATRERAVADGKAMVGLSFVAAEQSRAR